MTFIRTIHKNEGVNWLEQDERYVRYIGSRFVNCERLWQWG